MIKSQKILELMSTIQTIRFENENGGAYAYVKFLASTRVLLQSLKTIKKLERQAEKIEAINWLFNEYLAVRFTNSQKIIFENSMLDLKETFQSIKENIEAQDLVNEESFIKHYAVAA